MNESIAITTQLENIVSTLSTVGIGLAVILVGLGVYMLLMPEEEYEN